MGSSKNDDEAGALRSDLLKNWLQSRFDGFEVQGAPREGTYGQVWLMRATDQNTVPKRFALKTLDPRKLVQTLDEHMLRNFERELRLWLALPYHFNVLSGLNVDLAPAPAELQELTPVLPLVSMPFCETTLEAWTNMPLSAIGRADRLFALVQLCNGLAWVYRHGIQGHGDLKPSNVLITNCGLKFVIPEAGPFPSRAHPWLIRLADFGWADAWVDLGFSDKAWRPYLAPERFFRDVRPVASDMFAVGIIAAELLQGFHPAGDSTANVGRWKKDKMQRWATQGPRELSQVEPDELREALCACLAPSPDLRPAPAELIAVANGVLHREFGFEIQPLIDLWNQDAAGELDRRAAASSATLRAAWAAEQTAALSWPSRDTALRNLEERLTMLGEPATLLQYGEWLVLANSIATLLRERGEAGDIERIRELAGRARDLTRGLLIPCRLEDWQTAWDQGLKKLMMCPKQFEGFTDFVRRSMEMLESVSDPSDVRQLFQNSPPRILAAYHYCLASRLHGRGRNTAAIFELDRAIQLLPAEEHLHYIKTIWSRGISLDIVTESHDFRP